MAILIPNDFASYEMTDDEILQGHTLTITQKQVIQNLLSIEAAIKLGLEPNPTNLNEYIQQEAHSRGVIDAYKYLLDMSDASEERIRADAGIPTQEEI